MDALRAFSLWALWAVLVDRLSGGDAILRAFSVIFCSFALSAGYWFARIGRFDSHSRAALPRSHHSDAGSVLLLSRSSRDHQIRETQHSSGYS
jgi:hypothetical protein